MDTMFQKKKQNLSVSTYLSLQQQKSARLVSAKGNYACKSFSIEETRTIQKNVSVFWHTTDQAFQFPLIEMVLV